MQRVTRLVTALSLLFAGAGAGWAQPDPNQGPGGPVLVITSPANPFTRYYAEILRAEGLNAFAVTDIGVLTAGTLATYDVAVLGEMALSAGQVAMLTSWVNAGGKLIAMRPDPQLAGLLGLTDTPGTLANAYLLVSTASGPGVGIVGQTIQFHGSADLYVPNGATVVATLYSNATTATASPAVTLLGVGTNGGQAAAFSYDLARSVVYTRQGNPAWVGQERDGELGLRANELFFPDWIDLNKVAIPQADEQQRLLANLILRMGLDRKPLPRFWYFPRMERAVVVMTGDQHGCCGSTVSRFGTYVSQSPPGCSIADWECVRATSYIYPGGGLSDAQGLSWHNQGFELAVHVDTGCAAPWPGGTPLGSFNTQLAAFAAQFPSLPGPSTQRMHCVQWQAWSTHASVELAKGIRLDTNYYYWPAGWILDRPGVFTGSGMPMRFAALDGSMIDVYQAATQMTDESGQSYPFTPDVLLANAVGPLGYYGVFTANHHTDNGSSSQSDDTVTSALTRGVPVVSARQMLEWLDGRNASSFGSIAWATDTLAFTVTAGAGANGLRALLPRFSARGDALASLTRGGTPIAFTLETIKGMQYAVFSATTGSYEAVYPIPDGDGDGVPPPNDCDDTDDTIFPGAPEQCDGDDDDCDAVTDEDFPGLGSGCTVGVGACQRSGTVVCTVDGLGTECSVTPAAPSAERCNGIDDDCDGQIDDGFAGLGGGCTVGLGACQQSGVVVCTPDELGTQCNATPGTLSAETCNGIDDDCDGTPDDGNPGGGVACSTGQLGVCAAGTFQCQGGTLVCVSTASSAEVCDGQDNDCDGTADDGNPGGGGACTTGQPGVCAAGTLQCQGGSLGCVPTTAAATELCASGADENCDGQTDEAGCVMCLPGSTVVLGTQTRRTTVRLSAQSNADRVQTRGTFVLPSAGLVTPASEALTVDIRDGSGVHYRGTLAAGSLVASGSGRTFRYADPTAAVAGVRLMRLAMRSDGVTVKYVFKAQGVNSPPLVSGAGTATLRIGSRCFTDDADVCTLAASGLTATCR